ncbi:hypothetical protein OQA88_4047 [Cercophora sp. LCS_1]
MGIVTSTPHPIYLPPENMGNITVRNLTITPLELTEAERLITKPNSPGFFSKIFGSRNTTPEPPAPTSNGKETIAGAALPPFSEFTTSIAAPDPHTKEQLRLTFISPGTNHRYIATFPGTTPQSLVMRHESPDPTTREYTVIYLPRASYLTILSSASLARWMAELPSTLPISSLSIPGTHNSPTHHTALPSVRCQAVSVRTQLDNGVRFLDIRVSCPEESQNDTDLALVHSAFPISLSGNKWFHDLLSDVYAYLDDNPSETVLISVKREGTGKGSDQTLSKILAKRYVTDRWNISPRIPELQETRGKVVLVRRFNLDESIKELGIDGSVWPDNCADGTCGGGLIRIQDFYEVTQTEQIETKIELARAQLERAGQQACVPAGMPGAMGIQSALPIFINFLSASNFFNASCWPDRIAAKINPEIIEYLCTGHGAPGKGPGQLSIGDAGTGIVVIDWVGHNGDWDLVRCIVGWNARLQLKQ